MSSGELALAWVSSWQVARTSTEDVGGDDAVAQPARRPDSSNGTIRIICRSLEEPRGSIVCSSRLYALPPRAAQIPVRLRGGWLADDEKAPMESRGCHYGYGLFGTRPKRTVRLYHAPHVRSVH
jgi:hypothetical protein